MKKKTSFSSEPFPLTISPIRKIKDNSDVESEEDVSLEESSIDYQEERDSSDDLSSLNADFQNKSVLDDGDFILGGWFDRASNSFETQDMMGRLSLSDESSIIWAKDLDLRHHDQSFNETNIPADDLHSQLSVSGNLLKDSVKPKLANSQTDASNDPKPNFLIVNIGYILSQPAKNGSKFVSFPIRGCRIPNPKIPLTSPNFS